MNILIVGAGAIGVAVGTALQTSGVSVTFLARGETKAAIEQGGIHRIGLLGEAHCPPDAVTVTDSYDQLPRDTFDYVIISVKAMANEEVCQQLASHADILTRDGKLVLFQNGWGNDEIYLRRFPQTQVCCGRLVTGFRRTEPNISEITVHSAPVLLGNLYGLDVEPLRPLAQALDAGGIPADVTQDVAAALWAKMLYNCSLNPLGAVLGLCYGDLTKCPEGSAILSAIVDEVFAVMTASGYHTYWPTADAYKQELFGNLIPTTYAHVSSTLQDIQRKHPTEIDILSGKIIQLGEAHGIDVPVNRMLYRQIKLLEANY
ncbi:MAG: 2-dehydropantoate 2-reductase [Candidatus Onthomonas sp.]|nr:2-dehydropantoate 2-reductase [Candidatus Onthomonas sp.]